uniref:peptidylprolyl isomerase n=1 Tax=Odontella aurita TaxID=265563 RepID=A0A7S4J203_9STRA|mmetsp:Transcript_35877/g.107120  ORF Transcript_35877/g.107120 Transcript_35877/m.107120 type:complete len:239 (+) Transcript_35877:362-1078(+)|eukprot:CAMPEP_0113553228 /NCGR_PEP_ID=MMETSP0015_2-20120614/15501_1 /TAXON_ID=2838 /ORGANISM="Odontella" /LENGTH=238 /DNA_ID=CAMNT_0000454283 /DNA_START=192 /DNA_END=908 /DNA_ORIENTATION=+ /assembly_acc=CAM_ASM_000160
MSTLLSAARLLSVLLLLRPNHRCHALSLLSDRGNRFDSSSANRPRGAPKTTAAAAHADRRNVARDIIAGGAGIFCTSAALAFSPAPSFAMYENAPAVPEESQQIQLPSGVMYVDLRPGSGDVVEEGKRVNVQWVLKRSNGYFVDSSSNNDGVPFIFTVGDPKGAMAGVDEGIRGMRVGGIRRIIVPPNLAYVEGVEDGKPGPIPAGFGPKQRMRRVMLLLKDIPGEYIVVDVKATRVQ